MIKCHQSRFYSFFQMSKRIIVNPEIRLEKRARIEDSESDEFSKTVNLDPSLAIIDPSLRTGFSNQQIKSMLGPHNKVFQFTQGKRPKNLPQPELANLSLLPGYTMTSLAAPQPAKIQEKKTKELEFNPWNVTNFNNFLVYGCPECTHQSHDRVTFAKHAASNHHKVRSTNVTIWL